MNAFGRLCEFDVVPVSRQKQIRTEPGAQEVLRILTSVEYGNPV